MMEAVVRMGGATSVTSSPFGNNDSTATHFGGFVGYQQQWDGAVVGLEGTYNWLDKSVAASNTISGSFALPAQCLDLFRGRLGDGAHHRLRHDSHEGRLGGEQLHHALCDLRHCPRARWTSRAPPWSHRWPAPPRRPGSPSPAPFTVSEVLNNQFGYGYAAGVGVDFCLMANLFARLEYEYVQFPDFQGLNAHLHNVRAGAAFKF